MDTRSQPDDMWLVLCGADDVSALWAFRGLRRRLPRVELVIAEVLACSVRWHHRLAGSTSWTRIDLPDGRILRHDRVRGVLNRLTTVPPVAFTRASRDDRDYASEETMALWASWLRSLPCQVVNRPTGQFVAPAWFPRAEWVWRARRAGLSVATHRESSADFTSDDAAASPVAWTCGTRIVFVIGDRVIPDGLPTSVVRSCLQLAADAQVGLVGVGLRQDADRRWQFAYAEAFPDLRPGGPALLNAMASALRS